MQKDRTSLGRGLIMVRNAEPGFLRTTACLHRLIKAEHRCGNLKPTYLPVGTVAIDGKNVATLRWHDLCRVLDLKSAEAFDTV